MNNKFIKVPIKNNFYQTSSFFPMPVVLVTTKSKNGLTNIGAYSLVFPFGIAGEGKHSMMLISRHDSNTAHNIRKYKKCALNFIPYKKNYLKNTVMLGYPGDTTEQKLRDSIFTLIETQRDVIDKDRYPMIIEESVQVFECSWINDKEIFKYSIDEGDSHFLLKIDKIIMKEEYYHSLTNGNYKIPSLPVDYGYRDSKNFHFVKHKKAKIIPIPKEKGVSIDSVKYAIDKLNSKVKFNHKSYEKLSKIPRIFLNKALKQIADYAEKNNINEITPDILDEINKKRHKH